VALVSNPASLSDVSSGWTVCNGHAASSQTNGRFVARMRTLGKRFSLRRDGRWNVSSRHAADVFQIPTDSFLNPADRAGVIALAAGRCGLRFVWREVSFALQQRAPNSAPIGSGDSLRVAILHRDASRGACVMIARRWERWAGICLRRPDRTQRFQRIDSHRNSTAVARSARIDLGTFCPMPRAAPVLAGTIWTGLQTTCVRASSRGGDD